MSLSSSNKSNDTDRADLRIYFLGYLLNGPQDPIISNYSPFNTKTLGYIVKNNSADEIPFAWWCYCNVIRSVAPGSQINFFLNKLTDLTEFKL